MKDEMDYAVVMACDANYAPYALFLASQIALAHPSRNFDICIFSQDLLDVPPALRELGITSETISGENPFRNGPNPSRHGEAAYLRLLIPPRVAHRYKRLLYLDSDIFLGGTGIDRLFTVDMLGLPIAAVRDNQQWRTPKRHVSEFKILGLPCFSYFNSGVLLIDVELYQSERILEQCLAILAKHPEALSRHDQSLLNLVLKGRWAELSPVWNWQYTWSSRFFADLTEPRLLHFIGPRKPWKDTSNELPARFRLGYATFLTAHFPTRADITPLDSASLGWPVSIGKIFFKHLISAKSVKNYLNRFEHALVTSKSV